MKPQLLTHVRHTTASTLVPEPGIELKYPDIAQRMPNIKYSLPLVLNT
jgi:hypothetical protein